MSQLDTSGSSWIRLMTYTRFADTISRVGWKTSTGEDYRANGFLVVKTKDGNKYAHAVPSWCVGLLAAAKSKGRAYGKLVRGKFPSVKLDN